MSVTAKLIIDDLTNFHILTTDMKEKIIKAATNKVNIQAAMTRKKAIEIIQRDFTIRNTFTARQVQFTPMPAGRYSLSAIHATVGITEKASYMTRQEEGGLHRPRQGKRLAIPTDAARGGNKRSPVLRKNQYSRLKTRTVRFGKYDTTGTYRSRIAAMAAVAAKRRGFISMGHKLFFVENFQKKSDNGVTFRIRQIYGFDKKATVTKRQPWLKPATDAVAAMGEKIFISEMKKQEL